ncbi:hypothetical protein B0T25DRAFT_546618 [Lasiosphaeria hispida]|uniref:MARVEL domain-containing protein n=1 Tax=Lasiosphaeria hispida TaxID=260671 RepID=A0AAJ0HDF8_9PEZI|nr:hypothetical protein B0T25DRAFT_546618 [Lasiosphaeria hispida]
MAKISKIARAALVLLRLTQLGGSVVNLGFVSRFVYLSSIADAEKDPRLMFTIIVCAISTVYALIFIAPFTYTFLAFPADFVFFALWLTVFSLVISRVGTDNCDAVWFRSYWVFYWGSSCVQFRLMLAFSFIVMFCYLLTSGLGAWVSYKVWRKPATVPDAQSAPG